MGNAKWDRQDRQGLRIGILAIIIVACVWLAPAGSGSAASSGSDFSVSVTVEEANTMDLNANPFLTMHQQDVEVEFVSRNCSDLSGTDGSDCVAELIVTVSNL